MTLASEIWQADYLKFVAQVMGAKQVVLQLNGEPTVRLEGGILLSASRMPLAVEGGMPSVEVAPGEAAVYAPVTIGGAVVGRMAAVLDKQADEAAETRLAVCGAAPLTFIDAKRAELINGVIEAAAEGIVITKGDPIGEIVYVNGAFARLIGGDRERLKGRTMHSLLFGGLAAADFEQSRFGAPSVSRGFVAQLQHESGVALPTEVSVVPLASASGVPIYYAAIHRDVTESALMQERIARTDRLASLGTLAGGVAHEINNPLTYIGSNLDFVRRCMTGLDTPLAAEITEALGDAQSGVQRVQRIVRELGEFASPRVGDAPVDVGAALQRAIALTQNEIRHVAALSVEIAEGIPSVFGSEAKLTQVFVSLLLNAAQAISPNSFGTVDVSVAIVDGQLRIEVADSGMGIPSTFTTQVFDPFFTTKEVGKGTGLGLSFCHATVTAMGGSISHAPGAAGGTVFTITFPLTPRGADVEVASTRPRILVIDDEPLVTRALGRLLETWFDCDLAVGGAAAVDKVLTGAAYDCIVCDVMMPDVSGIDLFTKVLVARPELAGRFVFMTGGTFTPQSRQFLSTIANPIVAKPVDADALRRAIDGTIRKGA